MHEPDCLLARFLKSRYFVDSDFLSAKEGTRPSFGWKSILHGRELLQKGLKEENRKWKFDICVVRIMD